MFKAFSDSRKINAALYVYLQQYMHQLNVSGYILYVCMKKRAMITDEPNCSWLKYTVGKIII